jgi:dTMP kinase
MPFIVIEGLDGSGKSTLAASLAALIGANGYPTLLTREPTDTEIGSLIRANLHGVGSPFDEHTRCLLFAADRQHHLTTQIEPALVDGKVVICDRYIMSTFAYQRSTGNGPSWRRIYEIHGSFRQPDLILFLDISVPQALERLQQRQDLSVYETSQRLEAIRRAYLAAPRPEEAMRHIDASGTKDEVLDRAVAHVEDFLGVGLQA